jgi:hypothetical protein
MTLIEQLLGRKPHPIPPGLGRSVRLLISEEDGDDIQFIEDIIKQCPECGKTLPAGDFYVRSDGRLSSWCRVCAMAKDKAKRLARKETP